MNDEENHEYDLVDNPCYRKSNKGPVVSEYYNTPTTATGRITAASGKPGKANFDEGLKFQFMNNS